MNIQYPTRNAQVSSTKSATLRLTEMFYSIQGESTYAGLPCIFIRTSGCDLRCTWCDTAYAFHGGDNRSIESILRHIRQWPCKLVEITGGEPLLQKNVPVLAEELLAQGYTVLVETGGHRDVSVLDPRVVKIMDIKCPGSGESGKNRWENLQHLKGADQVKFVIRDRTDYDWAVAVLHRHNLAERVPALFSPVFGEMPYEQLAEWILADGLPVRMQLQLHKFIWDPAARGR